MNESFGRDRRIRKRSEFLALQQRGRRITTRHFALLVGHQMGREAQPQRSRIGLVVTKKIGNAVTRNRVKRLCRECFRRWPGLLPDGVDLVVIAREGADRLSAADVRSEWEGVGRLLKRRAEEALAQAAGMPHVSGQQRAHEKKR